MVFDEPSNAVFRFALQCAGAEMTRSVQPPPQQVVENQEAQQGAG